MWYVVFWVTGFVGQTRLFYVACGTCTICGKNKNRRGAPMCVPKREQAGIGAGNFVGTIPAWEKNE